MQWRVISDSALHFRCWDNEYVIYNKLSGDTHLLGQTAGMILLRLQENPTNLMTLAEYLALFLRVELDEKFLFHIEHILADLEMLALVEHT